MSIKSKLLITSLAVILAGPAIAGTSFQGSTNLKTSSGDVVDSIRESHYSHSMTSHKEHSLNSGYHSKQEHSADEVEHENRSHSVHPVEKTQNFNKNR